MLFNRLISLSNTFLKVEKRVIATLAVAITLLILLNVATRAASVALYWVDELAVYCMVWMVLIGASVMVKERSGIAASIFVEMLSEPKQHIFSVIVDFLILGFSVSLFVLCWYWLDLAELIKAGFDLEVFSEKTSNFIYEEPTNTLGVKKYFTWSVVPLISLSLTLHSTCNLIENLTQVTLVEEGSN